MAVHVMKRPRSRYLNFSKPIYMCLFFLIYSLWFSGLVRDEGQANDNDGVDFCNIKVIKRYYLNAWNSLRSGKVLILGKP